MLEWIFLARSGRLFFLGGGDRGDLTSLSMKVRSTSVCHTPILGYFRIYLQLRVANEAERKRDITQISAGKAKNGNPVINLRQKAKRRLSHPRDVAAVVYY